MPNKIQPWHREAVRRLLVLVAGQGYVASLPQLAQIIADAEPGWMKCSERMPEVGVPVLGYWHAHGVQFHIHIRREDNGSWCVCNDGDGATVKSVTHWRPLPEPPEEGE